MSDSLWPRGLCSPWNSLSKNIGVGSRSLLQGIFPSQGWSPGILHCRQILYQLIHQGSPIFRVHFVLWDVVLTLCWVMCLGLESHRPSEKKFFFIPHSGLHTLHCIWFLCSSINDNIHFKEILWLYQTTRVQGSTTAVRGWVCALWKCIDLI